MLLNDYTTATAPESCASIDYFALIIVSESSHTYLPCSVMSFIQEAFSPIATTLIALHSNQLNLKNINLR